MISLETIVVAIKAATSAVGLFDKIGDQIEKILTKSKEPMMPRDHRMKITGENQSIVARENGHITQTISADDLKSLPESQLRLISTLEKSMENHFSIWESVYPQLALMDGKVQKAQVEKQLENIIRDMKGDLEDVFTFLESCGLYLDDHYMHIRHLVSQVN